MTKEELQVIKDRDSRKLGHTEYHNALKCKEDRSRLLDYVAELEAIIEVFQSNYLDEEPEVTQDDLLCDEEV